MNEQQPRPTVGDVIYVNKVALVTGPVRFTQTHWNPCWNALGDAYVYNNIRCYGIDNYVLAFVVETCELPAEASDLNYLEVVLVYDDLKRVRLFNDAKHFFWLPFDDVPKDNRDNVLELAMDVWARSQNEDGNAGVLYRRPNCNWHAVQVKLAPHV